MLIVYQKRGILSKKIKISKGRNSAEFFLTFCVCVFLSTAYKKVFFVNRKSYFSESVDPEKTKQKQNKKSRHRFLDIVKYKTCAEFQGNILNPVSSLT